MKKRSQRKGGKGNLGDRVKVEEKVEDFKYLEHILHKKRKERLKKFVLNQTSRTRSTG